MRLIDAVGTIFSHNEIIAIWAREDEFRDRLVWSGMAWKLPLEYENIDKWQIVGVIPEKITEADRINININDAVCLNECIKFKNVAYTDESVDGDASEI